MRAAARWNPTLKYLGRFPDHLPTLQWARPFTLRVFWVLYPPQTFVFHRPGQEMLLVLGFGFCCVFFLLLSNYAWPSILTVASFSIRKASELYLGSWLDHFVCISFSAQADLVLQFRQGAHRTLEVTSLSEWLLFWLNKQHREENNSNKKKKPQKKRNPYLSFKSGTSEPSDHL